MTWFSSFLLGFAISFVSLLIGFLIGITVYWWATRKQRRLLRLYRQRERLLRQYSAPIE